MTNCPRCQGLLPDPQERFCPSCGADLELLPPPIPPAVPHAPSGWARGPGARGETPWERRDELGIASALVETTQRVLTSPAAFFRAMPVTGGAGSPLAYGVIIGYTGLVISAIYDFVLESVLGSSLSRFGGGSEAMAGVMPYFQGALGLGLKLVLGPFLLTISLALLAGIVHLALSVLGGAARGLEATFRVICYSEAAALLNIIPVCGGVISGVLMLVLMIIGVAEAHGTTRARAAAAVLLPIVLCCCCALIPLLGGLASLIGTLK
jgi:hypothetical protein